MRCYSWDSFQKGSPVIIKILTTVWISPSTTQIHLYCHDTNDNALVNTTKSGVCFMASGPKLNQIAREQGTEHDTFQVHMNGCGVI